jgi:hypothetical protein
MTDLRVEVHGGEIIITLPGTTFMVTYYKSEGLKLITKSDWTDDAGALSRSESSEPAPGVAANNKARELGWIV